MKKISLLIILAICLSIPSFTIAQKAETKEENKDKNEYLMQSILWFKYSGEMKALYYQGYNIARLRLDEYISKSKTSNKNAIILDLDETVIDNSYLYAEELLNIAENNNNSWKQWTDKADADTLPGAVDFLKYAASKKVEIFYITNREMNEFNSTLKNLKKYSIPFADSTHLLCKSDKNIDKEKRRASIAKNYDIILLCGDNLNDFSDVFYLNKDSSRNINDELKKFKDEFGKRFIIFPNPIYGYWENKIYNSKGLSDEQKKSARSTFLKTNLDSY